MLLLSLTAHRALADHPEMGRLVLCGEVSQAIQIGRNRLARLEQENNASCKAVLAQLLGRCLLAAGHSEEAEEMLRRESRGYQSISRAHVRWLTGLDQGAMMLHLNRPTRAAEALCAVADDPQAPVDLRIEAMAGAAVALHRAGECASAWHCLDAARQLCASADNVEFAPLVECVGLELAALQRARGAETLEDHAFCTIYREGGGDLLGFDLLRQQLLSAASQLAAQALLVAKRLCHLACLTGGGNTAGEVRELMAWFRARGLAGFEPALRVESALMMIARGEVGLASELIAPHTSEEKQIHRSRHAIDLHYCMSKLCSAQGRVVEALRWYSSHSREAILALRHQLGQRLPDSFLGRAKEASAGDTARSLLPLRYRRAYQYIIENLHDEHLSVQKVASLLGVTERALQMAFRTHLGMTPAELIRNRRMERIREDLCTDAGERDLMELAGRWGIKSRSTLASNYRSRFAETPMQTLQGSLAAC